jgi:Saxitoxin biosynthesis operon protein SxtJ
LAQASPARLTAAEGRTFALTLAAAFGGLAGLLWWRERPAIAVPFLGVAGAFALAGLLFPARLGPVYRGWMGLAHAISRVTTPIFMGVVYFLVITPVGLVRRAIGRNSLRAHQGSTGWVDRQGSPRGDLSRQF